MAAVLADVTIDDVVFALCAGCCDAYAIRDGWQGYCTECCAMDDDHDAGAHDFRSVDGCRRCDLADDRFDLPAIA